MGWSGRAPAPPAIEAGNERSVSGYLVNNLQSEVSPTGLSARM
jgi:hypothetical protein